jgi:Helix-turn-helix domain
MSQQNKAKLLDSPALIEAASSGLEASILSDYFDTGELAAELGVTPITVVRWRLAKKGPPVTYLGRRILYHKSSVKAWLAAQERPAERISKYGSSWKPAPAA